MLIVLLRHGVAESKESNKPDAERRLTEEGNQKMKRIGRGLARLLPGAGAIYSSPLPRAYESAQWVAKAYDGTLQVRLAEALSPGAGVAAFREALRQVDVECAYFVGHEPDLTTLMLGLTRLRSEGADLSLKKGGSYGLEYENDLGRLRWMLAPSMFQ